MDELANQLDHVLRYFGLESIVGLGVGAGGNILARFAYKQPTKVKLVKRLNAVFYICVSSDILNQIVLILGRSAVSNQRGVNSSWLD